MERTCIIELLASALDSKIELSGTGGLSLKLDVSDVLLHVRDAVIEEGNVSAIHEGVVAPFHITFETDNVCLRNLNDDGNCIVYSSDDVIKTYSRDRFSKHVAKDDSDSLLYFDIKITKNSQRIC